MPDQVILAAAFDTGPGTTDSTPDTDWVALTDRYTSEPSS